MENKGDRGHKEVPSVATTAKFTGNQATVVAQAQAAANKPENPDEVIARNTKQTLGKGSPAPNAAACGCCRCGK